MLKFRIIVWNKEFPDVDNDLTDLGYVVQVPFFLKADKAYQFPIFFVRPLHLDRKKRKGY